MSFQTYFINGFFTPLLSFPIALLIWWYGVFKLKHYKQQLARYHIMDGQLVLFSIGIIIACFYASLPFWMAGLFAAATIVTLFWKEHPLSQPTTLLALTICGVFVYGKLLSSDYTIMILAPYQASAQSQVTTLAAFFPKVALGISVMALGFAALKPLSLNMLRPLLISLVGAVLVLMGPALLMNHVQVDLKIPPFVTLWLLQNFFFICLSEEMFFRGFLQQTIEKICHKKDFSHAPLVALILTSVLFGLSHYNQGAPVILLATIAGLFYGWAYQKTGNLTVSVLVHFGVNLIHMLFFTYPALLK